MFINSPRADINCVQFPFEGLQATKRTQTPNTMVRKGCTRDNDAEYFQQGGRVVNTRIFMSLYFHPFSRADAIYCRYLSIKVLSARNMRWTRPRPAASFIFRLVGAMRVTYCDLEGGELSKQAFNALIYCASRI